VAQNDLCAKALSVVSLDTGTSGVKRDENSMTCFMKTLQLVNPTLQNPAKSAINRSFIPCGTDSSRTTILYFYNRHIRGNSLQALSLRAWHLWLGKMPESA
jgi:hypothetical protein